MNLKPKFKIGDIVAQDKDFERIISVQCLEIESDSGTIRELISYRTNIRDLYHPEEQFQGPYKVTLEEQQ